MDSIYVPHDSELFWTIKLLLTIKFPEIPVTNLINLRKIKGWRMASSSAFQHDNSGLVIHRHKAIVFCKTHC